MSEEILKKQVKDIMADEVITIHQDKPVNDSISLIVKNKISGLVVTDFAGDVVGVITAIDIFKLLNNTEKINWNHTAEDVMTPYTINITPNSSIREAALIMLENGIHRLIVTRGPQNKRPVGLISSTDILRELNRAPK